jgi:hypothetical protein
MPSKPSIPRTCQNCGKPFLAFKKQVAEGGGKYCSTACYQPGPVNRQCLQCRQMFPARRSKVRTGGGKFCGHPCEWQYRRIHSVPKPAPKRKGLTERFWLNVNKTETCWLWTASGSTFGYGTIRFRGKAYQSHRLSYELHNGPIPDGLCVLHRCDNPPCVRPAHLFLGTKKDNAVDMAAKERATSHLTADDVREIRRLYAAGGVTMKQIGKKFGVHQVSVSHIVRRLRWAHVP